jgi:hypothetical protein
MAKGILGDLEHYFSHDVAKGEPLLPLHNLLAGAASKPGAAPAAAATPAAGTTTTADPGSSEVQNLLSAILGSSQGQIPQGYADFFTNVIGPMQQQLAQTFHQQLMGPLMGGTGKGVPGMSAADAAVVNKARGAESSDLDAMNQAAMTASGPGAAGLQQFVLGPIANQQKLLQALQNALSFIPYSASGIGTIPPAAAGILSSLGVGGLPGTTPVAATPGAAAATGAIPAAPNLAGA